MFTILSALAAGSPPAPSLYSGFDPSHQAISSETIRAVNSHPHATWTAHASPRFVNATLGDVARMCGTFLKADPRYTPENLPVSDIKVPDDVPNDFDARTAWPKCPSIGHIRDQSSCGCCWAFGSTESYNDRNCIATGQQELLSVEDTCSCCKGLFCGMSMGCNGGQPGAAWNWFKSEGVVSGGDFDDIGRDDTCQPFSLKPCAHHVPPSSKYEKCPADEYPTPHCKKACTEKSFNQSFSADKHHAKGAYDIRGVDKIQAEIMQKGPVSAAFTVYSDFPTYKSGVYKHTTGQPLGGHAIKILGWGTESGSDYWLVANSWNEGWGDGGLFKIARGNDECGIESQVSAGDA